MLRSDDQRLNFNQVLQLPNFNLIYQPLSLNLILLNLPSLDPCTLTFPQLELRQAIGRATRRDIHVFTRIKDPLKVADLLAIEL